MNAFAEAVKTKPNKPNQTQPVVSLPALSLPVVSLSNQSKGSNLFQNGRLCRSQLSAEGAGQLGDNISLEAVDRLVRQSSVGVSKPERKRNALFA